MSLLPLNVPSNWPSCGYELGNHDKGARGHSCKQCHHAELEGRI